MSQSPLQTLAIKAPVYGGRIRLAPIGFVGAIALAVVIPSAESGIWYWLGMFNRVLASLSICSMAHSLEHAVYCHFYGRRSVLRFVVQLALIMAGSLVGLAAVYLVGIPLRGIGDGGTALLAVVVGAVWLGAAASGSLLVLTLERLIRPLTREFESRMNAAVLTLVSMTALTAHWASSFGYKAFAFSSSGKPLSYSLDLGFGTVWTIQPAQIYAWTTSTEIMAQSYLLFLVMVGSPAVMSASSKLSQALMANLAPLQQGFEALARGELDFSIPNGGIADVDQLNQTFNKMVSALAMAKKIEGAFGSYVSEEILEQIKSQHGEADLEPSLRVATVFFADIRGFTSMSERINPKQLLAVLNRFYEEVAKVVHAHQGFLVQYIGDAVVVVFNGPIDQPNHADMAASCAVDVQRAVTELNTQNVFPEAGELMIGIGVATGPMVAGNLGDSAHLLQYTVLGDTVNQAARITGMAPPGAVYVNQRNAEMIDPMHDPQALKAVLVKGRARKVKPHQIWPRSECTDVTEVRNISKVSWPEAAGEA